MAQPDAGVMFDYANTLYAALLKESSDSVYEGKVVETFGKLGISMSHYTPLFNSLKELGCIELLERGVRGRPTKYQLHDAPERDAFDNLYLTTAAKPATLTSDETARRIQDLERRLDGIELKSILSNFEQRLKKLERG